MSFSIAPATKGKQYTDTDINNLSYLVELQEKNPTQAAKDMKELGYKPTDLAAYKAGDMPLTEKQKLSSIDVANSIAELVNDYEWNDATGLFAGFDSIAGSDASDAEVLIKSLISKMTLPNLGVLK